ncbi:unnamed protein product, partial [Allacma fusca]
ILPELRKMQITSICISLSFVLFRLCLIPIPKENSDEVQLLRGNPAELLPILTCAQCGNHCVDKCGTRKFRLCCFRFHRKRRGDFEDPRWTVYFIPKQSVGLRRRVNIIH